jgi:hypothetical protein
MNSATIRSNDTLQGAFPYWSLSIAGIWLGIRLLKFTALATWFTLGFVALFGRTSLRSVVILLLAIGSAAAVVPWTDRSP